MSKIESMKFHGPGWELESADGRSYQVWAPNDTRTEWAAGYAS